MAFLSQNQMQGDDDEQKKYATSSSPAGTAAGGGGGGTTGGGASGAAPAQQSAGAPGTGFVNAQQFLNANQSGAQALGQGLNTAVQGEAAIAATDQAASNTLNPTTHVTPNAPRPGQTPAPAPTAAQTQATQTAQQTAKANSDKAYMDSANANQLASFDANALTNNQNRTALLQKQYGNGPGGYSLGQTNWDNMLATQGLGNAGMFLKTQQNVNSQLAAAQNPAPVATTAAKPAAVPGTTASNPEKIAPDPNDPARRRPGGGGGSRYTL